VVIEVDAVSVSNTFVGVNSVAQERESFMFLLNLQPISPRLPCRPIHVRSPETGNANRPIQRRIDEIIAWLAMAKIPVRGIASDGDKCYNARHERFFNFWNVVERREGIRAALGHIATYGQSFPISHLLHLAKNWHSRIMKYPLTVVVQGPSVAHVSSANIKSVIEMLEPRPSLTDESQIGKMRDFHPISIFRVEDLLTLIGAGKFTEAFMLLPITLLLNAVGVDTFTRDTRKDLLRQCFHIVRLMMAQNDYRRGRTGILVEKGKRGDTVTPLQERTPIRIPKTVCFARCL
jgi:hypothetical protein